MPASTSETIEALGALLEDERANVEALVALTAMATDAQERRALTTMGGQAAQACSDLHELLAGLGAPISARVGGRAAEVVAHERVDDRLRAFARQQQHLADRVDALLAADLLPEGAALLGQLRAVLLAHAAWALDRADAFAASRQRAADAAPPDQPEALAAPGEGADAGDTRAGDTDERGIDPPGPGGAAVPPVEGLRGAGTPAPAADLAEAGPPAQVAAPPGDAPAPSAAPAEAPERSGVRSRGLVRTGSPAARGRIRRARPAEGGVPPDGGAS